ncbi:MAG TPA: outer membrane protein transport protein [Alphaproteobacteria bacterium]
MRICLLAALSGFMLSYLYTPSAMAGGFYLQEQSASAMGSAFAGSAAMPRDASIVYYNPAGIPDIGERQIYAGASIISARSDMQDRGSTLLGGPVGGVDSDDAMPVAYLPHFYAVMPIYGEKLWFGVGVSTPFGLSTRYNNNWFGRYDAIKSELRTADVSPNFAMKVNDWLSFGGGANLQFADAELTSTVTNGVTEGVSMLKGHDWSLGFNAGVMIKPTEDTTVGVHYRSPMSHVLDGRINVRGVAGLNESTPGTAPLRMPEVLSMGVAHNLDERWTLLGEANWFGWNRFEGIRAVRSTNNTVATSINYDYSATWNVGLGFEYQWDARTTLRGGYEYDETPTADKDRSARIPDGDRNMFAAGMSYRISPKVSFDAGALYALIFDEEIDVNRNGGVARVHAERKDSDFAIVSFGLSYRF